MSYLKPPILSISKKSIKISNKWRRQAEIYKLFATRLPKESFSEEHALAMYKYESSGEGDLDSIISGIFSKSNDFKDINGYALGKKFLNLAVNIWKEDLKLSLLFKYELYEDSKYPKWWLDSILKDI